jgi:hypothetical protein
MENKKVGFYLEQVGDTQHSKHPATLLHLPPISVADELAYRLEITLQDIVSPENLVM